MSEPRPEVEEITISIKHDGKYWVASTEPNIACCADPFSRLDALDKLFQCLRARAIYARERNAPFALEEWRTPIPFAARAELDAVLGECREAMESATKCRDDIGVCDHCRGLLRSALAKLGALKSPANPADAALGMGTQERHHATEPGPPARPRDR